MAHSGEKFTVRGELGLEDEEETPWVELGERHASRGNSMCKGSDVGMTLACGWSGQS